MARRGPNAGVADRIFRARIARGLTEQQVADAIGCHSVTLIYDWEAGTSAPDGRLRGKLAEALGVTPRWLHLGGEPPE